MAGLKCASCQTYVGRHEVVCPGCGTVLLGDGATIEVLEPLSQDSKTSSQDSTTSEPEVPPDPAGTVSCPHCGAGLPDPDALVCIACTRQVRTVPTGRATGADRLLPPAAPLMTRRDRTASGVSLSLGSDLIVLGPGPDIVLGRDASSPAATVLREHDNVSRFHAWVAIDTEGGSWVHDANSTNGTFLDGRRLRPGERALLNDGSTLRLASDVELVVHLDSGDGSNPVRRSVPLPEMRGQ